MTAPVVTRRSAAVTLVGLGLFTVCLLLGLQDVFLPNVGLDPSWMLIVEYAARHDLVFGRDVVFTFGPYHYLATRLFDPATFPLVLAYSALSVVAIFWTALANRSLTALAAIAACFILLQIGSDAMNTAALFAIFLICVQRRDGWCLVLAALCAPLALAKYSFAMAILPLLALADMDRLMARRAPLLTLAFLAAALAANLAAGQPIEAIPDLLRNTAEVVLGFGRAMQVTGPKTELATSLLFVLAATGFIGARAWALRDEVDADGRPDRRPLVAWVGFVWTLFILFKMGFVRQDSHTFAFHLGAPCALALAFGFIDRPGRLSADTRRLFLILFIGFAANSLFWHGRISPGHPSLGAELSIAAKSFWPRLQVGVGWVTGQRYELMKRERAKADAALRRPFAPIVTGTVDALPWDQAPLIGSGLNYRPHPVLQSYAAFTPTLQALDKAHFQGPKAPDTLLLRLEDIDLRLPTLGAGPSLPVIGQRYDVAGVDPLGLILKRRAAPRPMQTRMLTSPEALPFGQWTPAPRRPGRLMLAHIKMERTLAGKLLGFLFREPLVRIDLRTADGREEAFRFIPDMAQLGVAVSPVPAAWEYGAVVLLDPASPHRSEPLAALRLVTNGKNWAFKTPTIAFEEITLAPGFAAGMPETVAGSTKLAALLKEIGIDADGGATPAFQATALTAELKDCRGSIDFLGHAPEAKGLLQAKGWAWDLADGRAFERILFVDESNSHLIGAALSGAARPDVQTVVPQVTSPNSGWTGALVRGAGGSVRAYGMLDDGRACQLGQMAWPG
jgi:hypothetical protein